jgi:hypothetical protein
MKKLIEFTEILSAKIAVLDASQWASWVQAFGSIAAIGAAIFVMKAQGTQQRRFEKRQYLERQINLALAGVYFSERLAKALEGVIRHSNPPSEDQLILGFLTSKFASLSRTVDNIPSWC